MGRTSAKNYGSLFDFSTSATETSSDESVISSKSKTHKCTFAGCFAAFSKSRKLINHVRRHTGERPYVCDKANCNKKYTNSSHLRRHIKLKHEHVNERVLCTFEGCERELANKCILKKHVYRCHNPNRLFPFSCVECGEGFHKKRQLQQHAFVHTGQLPYGCDECEKRFMTVRDCNKHKKVHLHLYPCECNEMFAKWTSLVVHRRTCKKKNLFKCQECDKEFRSGYNFNQHRQIHFEQNERDLFVCPYDDCDRYYHYKKNLTVHVKYFHEKEPKPKIPCHYEGCNKLLSKMQSYKIHVQKCHLQQKVVKKPRKPRKDKGIPRKSVLSQLVNIEKLTTLNCEQEDINKSNVECVDKQK